MTKKELKLLLKYVFGILGYCFAMVGVIIWALIQGGYITIY